MIAKCQCENCRGNIEFETAEFQESGYSTSQIFGQKVPCPHCGEFTILFIENNPSPSSRYATKLKKTEFAGGGALVQLIGVLFCFSLVGAIIGIPLIIIGHQMSKKLTCSNCGNRLADAGVKICPICHFHFICGTTLPYLIFGKG